MYNWLATKLNLPGAKKAVNVKDTDTGRGKLHNSSPIVTPKHVSSKKVPKVQIVATRTGFKEVPVKKQKEQPTDYMLAAQNLMVKMGLSLFSKRSEQVDEDNALQDNTENNIYRNLDVIYKYAPTGGCIITGNERAANNIHIINKNKITTIINCTRPARSGCLPNYHESNPRLKYYDFPVACWNDYILYDSAGDRVTDIREKFKQMTVFFSPMLQCIEKTLRRGENVLIHCLAGAHRAGTTTIIALMHFKDMTADDATRLAKSIRPVIDPISDFPTLLRLFEQYRQNAAKLNLENVITLFSNATNPSGGGGAKGKGSKTVSSSSAATKLANAADSLKASVDANSRLVASLKQGQSAGAYSKRKKKANSLDKLRASAASSAEMSAYGLAATTGEFSLIEQRRLNKMTEANRTYRGRDRSPIVASAGTGTEADSMMSYVNTNEQKLIRTKSDMPFSRGHSKSESNAAVLSATAASTSGYERRRGRHTFAFDANTVSTGNTSMLPPISTSNSARSSFDTPYSYKHTAPDTPPRGSGSGK